MFSGNCDTQPTTFEQTLDATARGERLPKGTARGTWRDARLRDALRDTLRVAWVELKEPQGEHV